MWTRHVITGNYIHRDRAWVLIRELVRYDDGTIVKEFTLRNYEKNFSQLLKAGNLYTALDEADVIIG